MGDEKKIRLLEDSFFRSEAKLEDVVSRAADCALKNPRVFGYAPVPRIVFEILKIQNPGFSVSTEVRKALNEWVKNRYPELYRLAKEELKKRKLKEMEELLLE